MKLLQKTFFELNPIGPGVYFEHLRKLRFPKRFDNENSFWLLQCKYLQFERPLGIEFDTPIHKRLAINVLLRVGQKGPPPGSDRVKSIINYVHKRHNGLISFVWNCI